MYQNSQYNQYSNYNIYNNINKKSNNRVDLISFIISIINVIYDFLSLFIFIVILFLQISNAEAGSASGWFLLILPLFIGIYFLSFVPDFFIVLFSFLNKKKNSIAYPILIIILSIIGCLIMSSNLLNELLVGVDILRYIYIAFKILIIIYTIVQMFLYYINRQQGENLK